MPYIPINSTIYANAFSGALAGMALSDKTPISTDPAFYTEQTNIAAAFAQSLDTVTAVPPGPSPFVVGQLIQSLCSSAWQERCPPSGATSLDPNTYTELSKVIQAVASNVGSILGPVPGLLFPGMVSIDGADQTIDYLASKLVAGTNITLTVQNPGASETLKIDSTGGGGAGFTYPNRVDCSVNSARVDDANSDTPVIRTITGGNVVGGYNGGGIGSKAILGFDVGNLLPLGGLTSLQWTAKNLMPYNPSPWPIAGYCNLIVDINGNGSVYKIFIIDPQSVPALLQCTITTNGDGSNTIDFDPLTNLVLVIGLIPPVVPTVNLGPGFLQQGFSIASILASYPLARFARANSLDGGLPKLQVIPPWLIVQGDSNNNKIISMRLLSAFFNGVQV